jgi:aminoglycoside phosphotransferase (APT) family kinase protein
MPTAEVDVTVALVRALLADQCPDLADLDIAEVATGWDNVMFRLGPDLGVRVPRRQAAAELLEAEQRWLSVFAGSLPKPVPVPVRSGTPARGYPWSWSVVPWFEGRPFAPNPPRDLDAAAQQLGQFVAALQRPVDGLPLNPFRGRPLRDLDERVRVRLAAERPGFDVAAATKVWDDALAAPDWDGPAMLLHGDLHPLNVVVDDEGLVAVIDFGDITGGDPAADYIAAWLFFDEDQRNVFVAALADGGAVLDEATWRRGRGAALSWCTAVAASSADHPVLMDIALAGIERLSGTR